MSHTAEFSQVGRSGTTVVETSFGLDLRADYLIGRKVVQERNRRRVVGRDRYRVIRVMSPCCSSAYSRAQDNPRAPLACHKCRALPPWPEDLLDFSLSSDYTLGQRELEPLVEHFIPSILEASMAASGLYGALDELFSTIKAGNRVKSVVTLRPASEV